MPKLPIWNQPSIKIEVSWSVGDSCTLVMVIKYSGEALIRHYFCTGLQLFGSEQLSV